MSPTRHPGRTALLPALALLQALSSPPRALASDCDIVSVADGALWSLAVQADGTVWHWGEDPAASSFELLPVTMPGVAFSAAFTGGTLRRATDGTGGLWVWGGPGYLANGTVGSVATPISISLPQPVASFSELGRHALVATATGEVWAWGENLHGQLGDGTTAPAYTPVQSAGLTEILEVAAGDFHSLARRADGTVVAYGKNIAGQLGIGVITDREDPTLNPFLADVVQVSAGNGFSSVLKADATVWTFGTNKYGQLGDGSTIPSSATPLQVPGLPRIRHIHSSEWATTALAEDGTVWVWGLQNYTEFCTSALPFGTYTRTPILMAFPGPATSVHLGFAHTLANLADGTIWACGFNSRGQLGDGTRIDHSDPVRVLIDPDQVPPDQGNVLLAFRSGADVELRFPTALARRWGVYRDPQKSAIGASAIQLGLATAEWSDSAAIRRGGTDFYYVRGLSPCSNRPGP